MDLLDGLDISETEYKLPNGKTLKIVALDIFQRLDVQSKIKVLNEKDEGAKSEMFKEVARLAVVDDEYEPFLTKKDLNKLSRANNGEILFEIFNKVMELSGASGEDAEAAKKK